MKKFTKFTFGALFLFGALAIASCGGNNDTPTTSGDTPVTTSTSGEHQHSYEFNSFEWIENPGAYVAKAVYKCACGHATAKYEAIVTKLDTSVPATCKAEGVNKWKASYDGHEDTKDEVLPKLDHVKGDDGFCSLCHEEWLGETSDSLELSRSVTSGDKLFIRFPVLPGRLYHYAIDLSFLGSGTSSFFVDTEYNKTPVVEEDPVEVPSNSDGYVYFVLDIAKTGTFEMSFLLIDVHDHEPNGLGFCMHCGKYLGSTVNDGSKGIDMQPIFAQEQSFFRVKYYPNRYHNVFISSAENALHEPVKFALYYFDTDHTPTLIEENITTEAFVEGDLDIHSYDRYIYVTYDSNDAAPSGNAYLAPLAFNGYDDIPTIRHYHGPSIVTDDITSLDARFIDVYETSPYYKSRYIVRATGLTIGTCYRMKGEDFGINTLEAYTVQANLSTPVELRHGEYFVAPSDEVVFIIRANNKLDSTFRVSIRTGHFHVNDEPYYGFYCWAHETPVWIGENAPLVLDNHYTSISLASGESKFYRFDINNFYVGDGFEIQFDDNYSPYAYLLYYFDGNKMVLIDDTGHDSSSHTIYWADLPDNTTPHYPVDGEEDVYYYLHIKNNSNSGQTLGFTPRITHDYNLAGVCSACGQFNPDGTTITAGTIHNDSFAAGSENFFRVLVGADHRFSLSISNDDIWSNEEVAIFYVDDEFDASPMDLDDARSGQEWLPFSSDGYVYIVIEPEYARNSVQLQVQMLEHGNMEHSYCFFHDFFDGQELTVDTAYSHNFTINVDQVMDFRFAFSDDSLFKITNAGQKIKTGDIRFYIIDENYDFVELSSYYETNYQVLSIEEGVYSDDGYIYMEITNTHNDGNPYSFAVDELLVTKL